MSQSLFNRVWSIASLTLVYFSLNAWSLSQQWQLSLPGDPFRLDKFTSHSVTLVAIPVGTGLLTLTSCLTSLHARRAASGTWAGRVPGFANVTLNPARPDGKVLQGVSLCIFVLGPAGAQVHFLLKFLAGTAYRGEVPLWSGIDHLSRIVPLDDAFDGSYSYDRLGDVAPTFFPFWQPWLFMLMEVVALGSVVIALISVYRGRSAWPLSKAARVELKLPGRKRRGRRS